MLADDFVESLIEMLSLAILDVLQIATEYVDYVANYWNKNVIIFRWLHTQGAHYLSVIDAKCVWC